MLKQEDTSTLLADRIDGYKYSNHRGLFYIEDVGSHAARSEKQLILTRATSFIEQDVNKECFFQALQLYTSTRTLEIELIDELFIHRKDPVGDYDEFMKTAITCRFSSSAQS